MAYEISSSSAWIRQAAYLAEQVFCLSLPRMRETQAAVSTSRRCIFMHELEYSLRLSRSCRPSTRGLSVILVGNKICRLGADDNRAWRAMRCLQNVPFWLMLGGGAGAWRGDS